MTALGRRRAIAFDLVSIGELQFMSPVLHLYAERHEQDRIYIVHHDETADAFDERCPALRGRVRHISKQDANRRSRPMFDLYVTTEQFVGGPPGVYTVTLFHGQPSKGVTFGLPNADPLSCNDAFFLYGPLQRQALDEHLRDCDRALPPHLSLFDIGYTKSDALINGCYNRDALLREMNLDPDRRTVLYAPAFNAGASLRECGIEIVETLCTKTPFNVIAKLPIDVMRPGSDEYSTGGVDWPAAIAVFEQRYPQFRLDRRLEADAAMACADVLVTCISSVGFEFLALGRPVVYVDTPRFFQETLPAWLPNRDVSSWVNRTAVNGGREFGPVVGRPAELPAAICQVLNQPDDFPAGKAALRDFLLYNPGRATPAAVDQLDALLKAGARSTRPSPSPPRWSMPAVIEPLRRRARATIKRAVMHALNARGYTLAKSGAGFIDARTTIAEARESGVSICEYRERSESDQRKRGRRDRIVSALQKSGIFDGASSVCEIGPGTGQFLERAIAIARPSRYEVYETDPEWRAYLQSEHRSKGSALLCHAADGASLRQSRDASCDVVHAHAVFVYLPLVQIFGYLRECVRVCKPGGWIVFDCFIDSSWTLDEVGAWLGSGHRFPVVVPRALLDEFAKRHRLEWKGTFSEVYGAGTTEYVLWRKPAAGTSVVGPEKAEVRR